ncbi:hypothetical protein [Roseibium album]|uniref:hypothetical protein n=1 Tax=Roseibium album TaxID=311410 RepID=UPI00391D3EAA
MRTGFFLIALCFLGSQAIGQEMDKKAVGMIMEAASGICGEIANKGSSTAFSAEGEGVAELKGLAKKLATLGIDAGIQFSDEKYIGVLREELSSERVDARNCRLNVFEQLLATIETPLEPKATTAKKNVFEQLLATIETPLNQNATTAKKIEEIFPFSVISKNCDFQHVDDLNIKSWYERIGDYSVVPFGQVYMGTTQGSEKNVYVGDSPNLNNTFFSLDEIESVHPKPIGQYDFPGVVLQCSLGKCIGRNGYTGQFTSMTIFFDSQGCADAFYENISSKLK